MTELAYLADMPSAYVRSFRARVTALPPGSVVLDRTYFYPAGGGQPSDFGTLTLARGETLAVVEVRKAGLAVLHRVRGSPEVVRSVTVGSDVEGTLDWERRHCHMRLHTAQHFLSARIFVRTRLRTRAANLAGNAATIDLEGPLPQGEVDRLSDDLVEAEERPRTVSIRMVPRAEWDRNPTSERSGLVQLPAQVDPVRIVEIEGSDLCPCGGTHVRSTGEIGPIHLLPPIERPDGSSRLVFRLEGPAPPTPPA